MASIYEHHQAAEEALAAAKSNHVEHEEAQELLLSAIAHALLALDLDVTVTPEG